MLRIPRALALGYWLVAAATTVAACLMVVFYTPVEATMGPVQKIFYVHLPMAINTFFACMAVFIGSIGYLWQRRQWWDDLAVSSAKVAVLLCSGVLLTGMLWGRCSWGLWWTWSPRLTFSLMLWLLYVVYLGVRSSIESKQTRSVVSAVYGITAFIDVPLVWLSARMMPDIHPASVALEPAMKLTLALWFVPVTMLSVGLVVLRYNLERRRHRAAEARASGEKAFPVIYPAGGAS